MAAASYEWAVSVDGEDWTVVETETDETFGVTADLAGMYVKVTVTAEDGETASDVTTEPVEPVGIIEIESAEATTANEIEVLLAYSIDPEDTVVELTKGNEAITATVAWNDDYKTATITTAANLTTGTYVVTISSIEDPDNEDSAEIEVEKQHIDEIVITTDVALTDPDDKWKAYASYDVLDQYGNSMRASTSITWAGSAKTITGDKATGKLTIEKGDHTDDWVYGEQIYVTGVNAKTGSAVNKTLTVGTQQSLDSLEIVGFVKKGTSTIVQTLPADFKSNTYYLIFRAKDQQGTVLDPDKVTNADVTFVSDNVLVVKEIGALQPDLTIEGETYKAAFVEPGIKVADGGEVTVTAIANKTGNKTEIAINVGEDAVVASFTISAPTGVVADGDKDVEIPFTAIDQDGNTITDFVTLAKQETFNKLTFNASEGTLKLAEQNDGSAKLLWTDNQNLYGGTKGWNRTDTTDGIDRPVSLTAIVVGGGTDNEMMSVSDKRRPNAIIAAKADEVYTEGTDITFRAAGYDETTKTWIEKDKFESFQFQDQYQKTIKGTDADEKYGDSTGFLAAANAAVPTLASSDNEISGHKFGVRVKYAGSGYIAMSANHGATTEIAGDAIADGDGNPAKQAVLIGAEDVVFTTSTAVESAATGEGFKFEIAKVKTVESGKAAEWDSVTPAKYQAAAVVDLSQIKSFAIKDLNKFYVGKVTGTTYHAGVSTGEGKIAKGALDTLHADAGDIVDSAADGLTEGDSTNPDATNDYWQKVEVKGTYNGKSVTIDPSFYAVTGGKITTATEGLNDNIIAELATDADTGKNTLNTKDLYDATTSEGVAKDAEDTLKATLYNIHANDTKLATAVTYKVKKADAAATVAAWDDAAVTAAASTAALVATVLENATIPAGTPTAAATELITNANTAIAGLAASLSSDVTVLSADNKSALTTALTNVNGDTDGIAALIARSLPSAQKYDTASIKVKLSDQKPAAATISGLKESYTIAPTNTAITNPVLVKKVVTDPKVKVLDQYGVAMPLDLSYRATDIVENPDAYAANNFSTSGNDSGALAIPSGAERGDTFTLVLTQGGATASTTITVGADEQANITGAVNNYETLVKNYLEPQRQAGLG